jgi:hypothetical protein
MEATVQFIFDIESGRNTLTPNQDCLVFRWRDKRYS